MKLARLLTLKSLFVVAALIISDRLIYADNFGYGGCTFTIDSEVEKTCFAIACGGYIPATANREITSVINGEEITQNITYRVVGVGSPDKKCVARGSSVITVSAPISKIYGLSFTGQVKLILPSTIQYIADGAFAQWGGSYSITEVENLENTQIKRLGNTAFFNNAKLSEIKFPNSLESIGVGCFNGCTQLKNVKFPDGLIEIGRAAFNATSLDSVILPKSCERINYGAFSTINSLKYVSIPEKVQVIDTAVFQNCNSLQTVLINGPINNIEYDAFSLCKNLQHIVLPESLKRIGSGAFSYSGLKDISLPDGCCDIDTFALAGTALDAIRLPSNLQSLRYGVFSHVSNLKEIEIPSSVSVVEENAFEECKNLKKVKFTESDSAIYLYARSFSSSINSVYFGRQVDFENNSTGLINVSLESVYVGSNVKSFPSDLFRYCSRISEVKCEDVSRWAEIDFGNRDANPLRSSNVRFTQNGVQINSHLTLLDASKINDYAFYNLSKLAYLHIGENVDSICDMAFSNCRNLKVIRIDREEPPELSETAFSNYEAELYVPTGSVPLYKDHKVWKKFYSIINPTSAYAGITFDADCLEFAINDDGVSVTVIGVCDCAPDGLIIPSNVTYEDKVYTVNRVNSRVLWRSTNGGLNSIVFPETIESVGYIAYTKNFITCLAKTPPLCPTGFDSSVYKCTLYVPEGYGDVYRNTYPWSMFSQIVEGRDPNSAHIELIYTADTDGGVVVTAEGGKICAAGAAEDAVMEVYDAAGRMVHRGGHRTEPLAPGLYLVKISGEVRKFRI